MNPGFFHILMIIFSNLVFSWCIGQLFLSAIPTQPLSALVFGCVFFLLAFFLSIKFYKIHLADQERSLNLTTTKILTNIHSALSNSVTDESKNLHLIDNSMIKIPFTQNPLYPKGKNLNPPPLLGYRTLPGNSPCITMLNAKLIVAWFEQINFLVSIRCDLSGLSYVRENHLFDLLDNLCSHLFFEAHSHPYPRVTLEITLQKGFYTFSFYGNNSINHPKLLLSNQMLAEHIALRSSGLYELKHIMKIYQGSLKINLNRAVLTLPERKNVVALSTPIHKTIVKTNKKTRPTSHSRNKNIR